VFERHGVLNEDLRQFYYHIMSNSVFCLAPEGIFAFTPRISESIFSGCIPVIISDSFEPPFSHDIDYEQFSVRVTMKDLPNLPSIIKNIPKEVVKEKLESLKRVAKMFSYNSPPQEGDATFGIIQQLEKLRNSI
jgi:xylogalacturonan beta-1,3-xylosyltransferase